MSIQIQALNGVVEEIFRVLEDVKEMFGKWDKSCHMPFIEKAMYLQTLREKLYVLGYEENFVETVIKFAYQHVFTEEERLAYAGNWYIVT